MLQADLLPAKLCACLMTEAGLVATHIMPCLQGTGVEMYSAQPGLVSSPLYSKGDHRKGTMWAVEFFQSFYGQSPVRGCRSLLRAATDPELVGKFLSSITLPTYNVS